jgi:hypothetical protein
MRESKIKIGAIFKNTKGCEFQVNSKVSGIWYEITFLSTGFTTIVPCYRIITGSISDYLYPSISGIGCLGFAKPKNNLLAYHRWRAMLARCYVPNDPAFPDYGAKGVTVCERWWRFDHFLEDLPKIEGYDEGLFFDRKLDLDKDKKQQGVENKIYSLETCCFLTRIENNRFRGNKRWKDFIAYSPDGEVYYAKSIKDFAIEHKLSENYISQCLRHIKTKYNGWTFEYAKE